MGGLPYLPIFLTFSQMLDCFLCILFNAKNYTTMQEYIVSHRLCLRFIQQRIYSHWWHKKDKNKTIDSKGNKLVSNSYKCNSFVKWFEIITRNIYSFIAQKIKNHTHWYFTLIQCFPTFLATAHRGTNENITGHLVTLYRL